jgi:hypothetical protein
MQASMSRFTIVYFLLLTLTVSAQKSIDTVKGSYDKETVWFKYYNRQDYKFGLKSLEVSKDSLNFRFRNNFSIVDIAINPNGQIESYLYVYLYKLNSKDKPTKPIIKKQQINPDLARAVLDKFYKNGIADFYDGYKIKGYPISVDGVTYMFELANTNSYKSFSFANPQTAGDIPEALTVNSFAHFIDTTLHLRDRFETLRNTLPRGRYLSGMVIHTVRE